MPDNQQPAIDVICDLRRFGADVNDIGTLHTVWEQASSLLMDRPLVPGRSLDIQLPQGALVLWVVDTHAITQVGPDTPFNVIDVLRNPTLLYRCRVCGEYGPLRCNKCEEEKRPERLCARHAHTIKDELSAYCPDHVPYCNCHEGCNRQATFRCQRCHKLFGDHVCRQNPRDPDVDYCQRCYQLLFEQCGVCREQGATRLGKSKCAFKTRTSESTCGAPLCWDHSFQWKIWGPHNRGVTLCAHHKQLLGTSDPSDLLFIMLTARPPYVRRGKRQSLPNPFRLRRIINRNRVVPLTFDQIGYAFRSISGQVDAWSEQARRNYDYMVKSFNETVSGLSQAEADLLAQVKAFYQRAVGWDAAAQIVGLEITDRFFKPGQPGRYRVQIRLNTTNKGLYIGRRGTTINQLRSQLNIEVDM